MTPGRLWYLGVHRPWSTLRRSLQQGDFIQQWRTWRGERAMKRAVESLPTLTVSSPAPAEVHLLTGRRFWHQTMFCLWTLSRRSGRALAPVVHDDGSLDPQHLDSIRRVFPHATINSDSTMRDRLDRMLPATQFPLLRTRWQDYPHIRKLINPHLGSRGPKLVLDSDLLFFRSAELLFDWLEAPDTPLHAVDCETAYGYPLELMGKLTGTPIAERVNVGITGLCSEWIDWGMIEHWIAKLQAAHGSHYLQEQALIAMLTAGQRCTIAPAEDYVTKPSLPEATACNAVMHHYVADSKRWYFQRNWRHALLMP